MSRRALQRSAELQLHSQRHPLGIYAVLVGLTVSVALAVFAGAGIRHLDQIASDARWAALAALLGILVVRRSIFDGLRGTAGLFALAFLSYGVLTATWSTSGEASLIKGSTYFAVAVAFSAAGAVWAARCSPVQIFRVLWPLLGLVALSSAFGATLGDDSVRMNESVELYQGLTRNSNFLGILLVCSLPAALFEIKKRSTSRWHRKFWIVVTGLLIVMLLATFSRASILAAFVIVSAFLFGTDLRKYALGFASAAVALALVAAAAPGILDDFEARYIYKGSQSKDLGASRSQLWNDSYAAAMQGGALGLGFGVSAEDASVGREMSELKLSSAQYGREKGNSTLAVVEELGWFGLILFTLFAISVFSTLNFAIRTSRDKQDRLILVLLGGGLAGLTINAQFEAWFLAPGAAATPVYWAFVGMSLAFSARAVRYSHRKRNRPLSRFVAQDA